MEISIISNNCAGVRIMQELKIRYDSPTIALQIVPEEFTKFCKDIKHYMNEEIIEYKDFSDEHKKYFANMYGGAIDYVCGLCGDVAIVFQHDDSWDKAKEKWDRRKARMHYDNLAFLFCLDFDRYKNEAQEFRNANLPNSYIFTRDFDIDGEHFRYTVPNSKLCFLDKDRPDHYYFEGTSDRRQLWGRN